MKEEGAEGLERLGELLVEAEPEGAALLRLSESLETVLLGMERVEAEAGKAATKLAKLAALGPAPDALGLAHRLRAELAAEAAAKVIARSLQQLPDGEGRTG